MEEYENSRNEQRLSLQQETEHDLRFMSERDISSTINPQDREPCAFCKQHFAQAIRAYGFGPAIKPACEPITLARKPLSEKTIAKNVLEWGTGGINIEKCRVGTEGGGTHCDNRDESGKCLGHNNAGRSTSGETFHAEQTNEQQGRFPANLIHDGSDEVVELFPDTKKFSGGNTGILGKNGIYGNSEGLDAKERVGFNDSGSASRFFYCAKASKKDRNEGLEEFEKKPMYKMDGSGNSMENFGSDKPRENNPKGLVPQPRANNHPTVKPTSLMQYLVRLVTPKGGTVLDPFVGSGSTGKACVYEGFDFIGIDLDPDYIKIADARINHAIEQEAANFEKSVREAIKEL